MDGNESGNGRANERKEQLKSLAADGGKTMFHAMCYTAGALLVTFLAAYLQKRIDQKP